MAANYKSVLCDIDMGGNRLTNLPSPSQPNDAVNLDYLSDSNLIRSYLNIIYPIGSIYINVNDTNPAKLFEFGTWSKLEGKFLLASSTNHQLGTTGGEESHQLTIDELPSHHHTTHGIGIATTAYEQNLALRSTTLGEQHDGSVIMRTADTGNNKAHNNMPPYYVVSIWIRVG